MSPPRQSRPAANGAARSERLRSQSDRVQDSGALRHAPVCRFCHGSGHGPVDTRDDTDRFALLARHAAENEVWDWTGRHRPRAGVQVLPTLALRLAEAVRERDLDDVELKRVLRAVAERHGHETARLVLLHLGRLAVAS